METLAQAGLEIAFLPDGDSRARVHAVTADHAEAMSLVASLNARPAPTYRTAGRWIYVDRSEAA